jgi:hypothetical protein
MRILYFTRDYTPHDYRFLKTLAQSGYHVGYLRLERGEYSLENRSLPAGIEPVQWAGGRRRVNWRDGLRLVSDLKRVIRDFRPDRTDPAFRFFGGTHWLSALGEYVLGI